MQANALAGGSLPAIQPLPGAALEAISLEAPGATRLTSRGGPLRVTLSMRGGLKRVRVDRIIALVGYEPDRSIYAELQVHECYATGGPFKLAASLMGEAGASPDCLAGSAPSADLLSNPEPGFFILGSKSYGRNSAFLIRSGLDQIRSLFAYLEREPGLDLHRVPAPGPARPTRRARPSVTGGVGETRP
jgi:hypothetical protein